MAKKDADVQGFLAPYSIGVKLRSLRTEKRLTLVQLAAQTGLSTALLSKLETSRMVPTLPTLATISRVYGVGLGHYFQESSEHLPVLPRQGRGSASQGSRRVPVNPDLAARRLDACLVDLAPGAPVDDPRLRNATALMVYVLEGRLRLVAGGTRETLETGDCAYLESKRAVAWAPAGKKACSLLVVTPTEAGRSGMAAEG